MLSSSSASELESLAGLYSAKRVVRRLVQSESGVHALLLYGARGSGKNALARIMSKAWVCLQPTEEGADFSCRSCKAFDRETLADYLHVAPTGPSAIIKTSAINGADEEKDGPIPVTEFLRTPPVMGANKVVLIEQAHRMNNAAFNALLKTLEEPLSHAKLILTTDTISRVPATIISRCLGVACETPSEADINLMFPQSKPEDFVLSEGAPGRLRTFLDHAEPYRAIAEFAACLHSKGPADAIKVADEFRGICEKLEPVLRSGARAANAEALEVLAIALARDPAQRADWTASVIETHRRVTGNAAAGIAFDALFTKLLMK